MFSSSIGSLKWIQALFLGLLLVGLLGCKGIGDDLMPSGKDMTTPPANTTSADFTLMDVYGNSITLYEILAQHDKTVLYLTMWCPVCNSHTDHMINYIQPNHPTVGFYLVDYISRDWQLAFSNMRSSGYEFAPVTTLSDDFAELDALFGATMSLTLVFDATGNILMQEDFKDGVKLEEILNQ